MTGCVTMCLARRARDYRKNASTAGTRSVHMLTAVSRVSTALASWLSWLCGYVFRLQSTLLSCRCHRAPTSDYNFKNRTNNIWIDLQNWRKVPIINILSKVLMDFVYDFFSYMRFRFCPTKILNQSFINFFKLNPYFLFFSTKMFLNKKLIGLILKITV